MERVELEQLQSRVQVARSASSSIVVIRVASSKSRPGRGEARGGEVKGRLGGCRKIALEALLVKVLVGSMG